jgi:hypothetical protein
VFTEDALRRPAEVAEASGAVPMAATLTAALTDR